MTRGIASLSDTAHLRDQQRLMIFLEGSKVAQKISVSILSKSLGLPAILLAYMLLILDFQTGTCTKLEENTYNCSITKCFVDPEELTVPGRLRSGFRGTYVN